MLGLKSLIFFLLFLSYIKRLEQAMFLLRTHIVDLTGKDKGREMETRTQNPEMSVKVQRGTAENTHPFASLQFK